MPKKQIHFQNDIKKIFKTYIPNYKLSKKVKDILNIFIIKFVDDIVNHSKKLMKKNKDKKVITSKIIQEIIIKINDHNYSKHLVSEGVKAYTLFSKWKRNSSKKRTSMSQKAKVIISVTKVKNLLKKSDYKVDDGAAVYLSGSLDFILIDLFELAFSSCRYRNAKIVNITDLYNVVQQDTILTKLFKKLKIKLDKKPKRKRRSRKLKSRKTK